MAFCSPEEEQFIENIEAYIGTDIDQLEINQYDYKAILDDTEDLSNNWQKLLDQANEEDGTNDKW